MSNFKVQYDAAFVPAVRAVQAAQVVLDEAERQLAVVQEPFLASVIVAARTFYEGAGVYFPVRSTSYYRIAWEVCDAKEGVAYTYKSGYPSNRRFLLPETPVIILGWSEDDGEGRDEYRQIFIPAELLDAPDADAFIVEYRARVEKYEANAEAARRAKELEDARAKYEALRVAVEDAEGGKERS